MGAATTRALVIAVFVAMGLAGCAGTQGVGRRDEAQRRSGELAARPHDREAAPHDDGEARRRSGYPQPGTSADASGLTGGLEAGPDAGTPVRAHAGSAGQ